MNENKRIALAFSIVLPFLLLFVSLPSLLLDSAGDYVYASWGLNTDDSTSPFGHAAIYVGPHFDQYGAYYDVVERSTERVQFTSMQALRAHYGDGDVRTVSVPDVSPAIRAAAAQRAIDVATAIANGGTIPWYSETYDFNSRNCVQTFQRFYLDVGANTEQVGSPRWLSHPGWLYTNFSRNHPVDGSPGNGSGDGGDGIGGAGDAGIESRPLWLGPKMANFHDFPRGFSQAELDQFIPVEGMRGEVGQPVTPKDVLGTTNAVSVTGIDYIDNLSGNATASIFGAETSSAIYDHDYAVCTRVQNYQVEDLLAFPYGGHWYWAIVATKPAVGNGEIVIPLTLRVNGAELVVDSRYLVEYYPPEVTGTVYNYQIRANNLADAVYLLDRMLRAAKESYAISFDNQQEPLVPVVYARKATYSNSAIHLTMTNPGPAQPVRFYGPTWTEPQAQDEIFVDYTLPVPSGVSEVSLPVGAIHDAVIYIEAGGRLDKIYVANGYWFAWDDQASGGTSQVSLQTGPLVHPAIPNTDPAFISPPNAEMTGQVTNVLSWSHIGMGYVFQQWKEPLDLSAYDAVLFYARGDGKAYRVKLESAAVDDNDFHSALFETGPEWRLVVVSFSTLQQAGWGEPVPWTGEDIELISFVTEGRPLTSVHLDIDRIAFLPKDSLPPRMYLPIVNKK